MNDHNYDSDYDENDESLDYNEVSESSLLHTSLHTAEDELRDVENSIRLARESGCLKKDYQDFYKFMESERRKLKAEIQSLKNTGRHKQ